MGSIGAPELIIVLLVVLLLFGSTKLPKLARSIGEASKEFKKGVDEGAHEPSPPAKTETVNMTKAEQEEFEAFKAFKAQREADRKDTPPAQ